MAKEKSNFMFPINSEHSEWEQELGMTKREYFAAKAMHGIIISSLNGVPENSRISTLTAVQWADDLISALNE
jgi:hypothetical protein